MDYEKLYKNALERAKNLRKDAIDMEENLLAKQCEIIFPELEESEDEKIRRTLIRICKKALPDIFKTYGYEGDKENIIAWLEKQNVCKPNYCHHNVDLSGCSEEYRKAYYDGWNNCNTQHEMVDSKESKWTEDYETGYQDTLWCIKQAYKIAKDENDVGSCWFAEKWLSAIKSELTKK